MESDMYESDNKRSESSGRSELGMASLSFEERPVTPNPCSTGDDRTSDEERSTTPIIQVEQSLTKSAGNESDDSETCKVTRVKRDSLQLPRPLEISGLEERGASAAAVGEMSPPPSPVSSLLSDSSAGSSSWRLQGETFSTFETQYSQCVERRHSVAMPVPWIKLTPPDYLRRGSLGEETTHFSQVFPKPFTFSMEEAFTSGVVRKGALAKLKRVPKPFGPSPSFGLSSNNGHRSPHNEPAPGNNPFSELTLANSKQRKVSRSFSKLQDIGKELQSPTFLPDINFKDVPPTHRSLGSDNASQARLQTNNKVGGASKSDPYLNKTLSRSACNLTSM